jgi:hypothetical protein
VRAAGTWLDLFAVCHGSRTQCLCTLHCTHPCTLLTAACALRVLQVSCTTFAFVSLIASLLTMRLVARAAARPAEPKPNDAASPASTETAEAVSATAVSAEMHPAEGASVAVAQGAAEATTRTNADAPAITLTAACVPSATTDACSAADETGRHTTRVARLVHQPTKLLEQPYQSLSRLDDPRELILKQLEQRARRLNTFFGTLLVGSFLLFELLMFGPVLQDMQAQARSGVPSAP